MTTMITATARITSVLVGASPTAAIFAREQSGREHRLEVSVEDARRLSQGQVLVLQWSAHTVPELAPSPAAGEIVDASFTVQRERESPPRTEAMALEAALGAKPGTFSGRV